MACSAGLFVKAKHVTSELRIHSERLPYQVDAREPRALLQDAAVASREAQPLHGAAIRVSPWRKGNGSRGENPT